MACFCFHKLATNIIIIEQPLNTVSDIGTPIKTWSTFSTTSAFIEPKQVKEIFENGQLITKNYFKIIIRYNSLIMPNMRVNFQNKNHNIIGIRHLYTDLKTLGKHYTELTVVEGEIS